MRRNLRIRRTRNRKGFEVQFSYAEGRFWVGFGIGLGNSVVYPHLGGFRSRAVDVILHYANNDVQVEHCTTAEDKAELLAEMVRFSPSLADLVLRVIQLETTPPVRFQKLRRQVLMSMEK